MTYTVWFLRGIANTTHSRPSSSTTVGEVFIGLPDDDAAEQVRDVLNRRYPVDSRRQLGEAVYDRLNLKRQVLESVIRADEKNGRDASEKKLELEFLEDVFESLEDII